MSKKYNNCYSNVLFFTYIKIYLTNDPFIIFTQLSKIDKFIKYYTNFFKDI